MADGLPISLNILVKEKVGIAVAVSILHLMREDIKIIIILLNEGWFRMNFFVLKWLLMLLYFWNHPA